LPVTQAVEAMKIELLNAQERARLGPVPPRTGGIFSE
jgi:hypothetical protein